MVLDFESVDKPLEVTIQMKATNEKHIIDFNAVQSSSKAFTKHHFPVVLLFYAVYNQRWI